MPLRSISRHGLNVPTRAASRHRRKSMTPIFIAGASRVFAPGCLSLFKVRTNGSQLRGGLRTSAAATNSREVSGHFRRHNSTYRKPLSSSSHTTSPEIFASHSPPLRRLRIYGERRITQHALILSRIVNSGAGTKDLHYPQEAEMSLSTGYCDFCLIYKAALCA